MNCACYHPVDIFFLIKATKILLILPYLANVKDINLNI